MKVHPARIFPLNQDPVRSGPVVYWMTREQRVTDNWGLIHAQQLALERGEPLVVVFALVTGFLGATLRQYHFMLTGLAGVADRLGDLSIPFVLLKGDPVEEICRFSSGINAGVLVTDFDPLRIKRAWRNDVATSCEIAFFEVDGHNIVSCRLASPKAEYGAYTLRPKLHRLLPEFLTDFPRPILHPHLLRNITYSSAGEILRLLETLPLDRSVPPVEGLEPGEPAAHDRLHEFIERGLGRYDERRNDPNAGGQSGLSPWLHFGQLSPQRVALEVSRAAGGTPSGDAFLEELIVRRELADNFCWYTPEYDRVAGFPAWALRTLERHRSDPRPVYSRERFETGKTSDPLWNAAQREMVTTGRMHGYLRMYWAKKILEWSASPEEAMETAIYLNDRYQLDGRDPNGYAGIAWSIGGVHDRAWGERPVFGMIRYMNEKGCRRKFDVGKYIGRYGD